MRVNNSPEYQVTITRPDIHEQSWWSRVLKKKWTGQTFTYEPIPVTVTDVYTSDRQGNVTLDPSEYRIIEGIHEGKHVDSACCSKPVRKEEVA